MAAGFSCSKNTLIAINLMYIIVSLILISVAVQGRTSNNIDSLPIVGGITACGVFLLFVSILGLIGTIKHHQVTLFFYMIILFLIFIIQISVSIAALSMDNDSERGLIKKMWDGATDDVKFDAEKVFSCCGLVNTTTGVRCDELQPKGTNATLPACMSKLQDKIDSAFNAAGGVGLFFSLTEFVGGIVAYKYRNMAANTGFSGE